MNRPITDDDLPAIFRAADNASLQAQRRYLILLGVVLSLLVAASLVGAISTAKPDLSSLLAASNAALLFSSVLLTGVIRTRKPEREWLGGRAIAESVKSLAWRYMSGAEPFARGLGAATVDQKFAESLSAILDQRRNLSWEPGGALSAQPQITDEMRQVRAFSLDDRKDLYVRYRINDQIQWYSSRAEANKRLQEKWFSAVIGVQLLAFLIALFSIFDTAFPLNLTSVLTSLAAAFLAWMQVKHHQELSQSYGIEAHELGIISSQVLHKNTEGEFSSFVADAESAMSREHTLWTARRDHL